MKTNLPAPTAYGAAAIYPYSDELYEKGQRESRYGDEYNMFTIVGKDERRRIWVPRRLASPSGINLVKRGFPASFESSFIARNTEQTRVVKETVELLCLGANFLVECPTGFGKTACAMDIIARMGKKTLVIVTKEDLRNQWIKAAKQFLGMEPSEVGLIQGDVFRVAGKSLVIAMVQSIAKEERYPQSQMAEFGLVIWDECIAYGARILMGDGETTVPIEVLVEAYLTTGKNPSVMSYNERAKRWEPRRITNAWRSGVRKIVEVVLEDGKSLRCTADHLLLTNNRGWVAAGELTSADDVMLY